MNIKNIFLPLAMTAFVACQQEETLITPTEQQTEKPRISLTEEGFLKFDTPQTLENCLEQITQKNSTTRGEGSPITPIDETEPGIPYFPEGFKSISTMKAEIGEEDNADAEFTGMTLDEYNITKSDQLLKAPFSPKS